LSNFLRKRQLSAWNETNGHSLIFGCREAPSPYYAALELRAACGAVF
jgi:hypothetical protein